MSWTKDLSVERKMDIIFYILLIITLPFKLMNSEYDKVFSIILTFFTVILTSIVFSKIKIKMPTQVYFIVLVFIFLSMYLGKVINFYRFFPRWDKFLHLISGPILTLMGYIIFLNLINKKVYKGINPVLGILFGVFFSIACAGGWEIFEFTSDHLFGTNAQNNSLLDTMGDIICGTIGGTIMGILMYLPLRGKNVPFFKKMMIDLEETIVKK